MLLVISAKLILPVAENAINESAIFFEAESIADDRFITDSLAASIGAARFNRFAVASRYCSKDIFPSSYALANNNISLRAFSKPESVSNSFSFDSVFLN